MKRCTTRQYSTLKDWRTQANLSQQQAADLFGISQQYYGRLENGVSAASGKVAKRIADTTGVPVAVLVGAA